MPGLNGKVDKLDHSIKEKCQIQNTPRTEHAENTLRTEYVELWNTIKNNNNGLEKWFSS